MRQLYLCFTRSAFTYFPLTMKRVFLDNIELFLSAVGVFLTFLVPTLWSGATFWKVAALTAAGTALLHGLIFWTIRRRQRHVRADHIGEIREMLQDVIRDQFAIINLIVRDNDMHHLQEKAAMLDESMARVGHLIDTLNEESLTKWKRRYKAAGEHPVDRPSRSE